MSQFRWTTKSSAVAIALAEGRTRKAAAAEHDITERQIYRWLQDPAFSAEVDRLSLMVGIASRAERLRIAQRAVRMRMPEEDMILSKADILDWLKFAQSETNGIKLDLAAIFEAATSLAGSGSTGPDRPPADEPE